MKDRPADANGEEGAVIDYRIAPAVLGKIVRGSLRDNPQIRLPHGVGRSSRHAVDVDVQDGECLVSIHLHAPLGHDLMALGAWVREHVGGRLATMTGMRVARLDVYIDGIYPSSPPAS